MMEGYNEINVKADISGEKTFYVQVLISRDFQTVNKGCFLERIASKLISSRN